MLPTPRHKIRRNVRATPHSWSSTTTTPSSTTLFSILGELGAAVTVRRNDDVSPRDIAHSASTECSSRRDPGSLAARGTASIVHYCAKAGVPLLGVCLGHQALGEAFGATVRWRPNCYTVERAW